MRVAVLTISDSVAKGEREDRSGPAVVAACRGLGWEVTAELQMFKMTFGLVTGCLKKHAPLHN